MRVLIYTCRCCGIRTRVLEGQDNKACACAVDYDVEVESDDNEPDAS